MQNSGKLLIIGILAAATALAGAGWWFRYNATNRAAEFWGPRAVRLIRDAPEVTLLDRQSDLAPAKVDISMARGISHLRYALLEDRSYDWPDPKTSFRPGVSSPRWQLTFSDPTVGEETVIQFSDDCRLSELAGDYSHGWGISCSPIAAGLLQVFAEYSGESLAR